MNGFDSLHVQTLYRLTLPDSVAAIVVVLFWDTESFSAGVIQWSTVSAARHSCWFKCKGPGGMASQYCLQVILVVLWHHVLPQDPSAFPFFFIFLRLDSVKTLEEIWSWSRFEAAAFPWVHEKKKKLHSGEAVEVRLTRSVTPEN